MTRPVWLLDVDGVINCTRPGWHAAPFHKTVWSNTADREFRIRWAPALIQRIRALHRSGLVEIRWCTTWCGDTSGLEHVFGLPALTSAFEVPAGRYVGDVKLAAARQVLADGRRLIWADDDEVPTSGDLYDELTRDDRSLLVRPDSRTGLLPEHMDAIETFAAAGEELAA